MRHAWDPEEPRQSWSNLSVTTQRPPHAPHPTESPARRVGPRPAAGGAAARIRAREKHAESMASSPNAMRTCRCWNACGCAHNSQLVPRFSTAAAAVSRDPSLDGRQQRRRLAARRRVRLTSVRDGPQPTVLADLPYHHPAESKLACLADLARNQVGPIKVVAARLVSVRRKRTPLDNVLIRLPITRCATATGRQCVS